MVNLASISVSVDNFSSQSTAQYFFLTHFHSDHYSHLNEKWDRPIFCSTITGKLLVHRLHIEESLIHPIDVHESVELPLGDNVLVVKAFDAHHCPGSLMFLFEGFFGRILHTGDFRFCPEMLLESDLNGHEFTTDNLYLDNTYMKETAFPSESELLLNAKKFILANPSRHVIVGVDNLGKEQFLRELSSCAPFQKHIFPSRYDVSCIVGEDLSGWNVLPHNFLWRKPLSEDPPLSPQVTTESSSAQRTASTPTPTSLARATTAVLDSVFPSAFHKLTANASEPSVDSRDLDSKMRSNVHTFNRLAALLSASESSPLDTHSRSFVVLPRSFVCDELVLFLAERNIKALALVPSGWNWSVQDSLTPQLDERVWRLPVTNHTTLDGLRTFVSYVRPSRITPIVPSRRLNHTAFAPYLRPWDHSPPRNPTHPSQDPDPRRMGRTSSRLLVMGTHACRHSLPHSSNNNNTNNNNSNNNSSSNSSRVGGSADNGLSGGTSFHGPRLKRRRTVVFEDTPGVFAFPELFSPQFPKSPTIPAADVPLSSPLNPGEEVKTTTTTTTAIPPPPNSSPPPSHAPSEPSPSTAAEITGLSRCMWELPPLVKDGGQPQLSYAPLSPETQALIESEGFEDEGFGECEEECEEEFEEEFEEECEEEFEEEFEEEEEEEEEEVIRGHLDEERTEPNVVPTFVRPSFPLPHPLGRAPPLHTFTSPSPKKPLRLFPSDNTIPSSRAAVTPFSPKADAAAQSFFLHAHFHPHTATTTPTAGGELGVGVQSRRSHVSPQSPDPMPSSPHPFPHPHPSHPSSSTPRSHPYVQVSSRPSSFTLPPSPEPISSPSAQPQPRALSSPHPLTPPFLPSFQFHGMRPDTGIPPDPPRLSPNSLPSGLSAKRPQSPHDRHPNGDYYSERRKATSSRRLRADAPNRLRPLPLFPNDTFAFAAYCACPELFRTERR